MVGGADVRGLGADDVAGDAEVDAGGADVVAGAAEDVAGGAGVKLKMSTTLEETPLTAQGMRLAHAISKPTSAHSSIRFPNPHNTTRKDAKINMATRTFKATSEDRDSEIRQ